MFIVVVYSSIKSYWRGGGERGALNVTMRGLLKRSSGGGVLLVHITRGYDRRRIMFFFLSCLEGPRWLVGMSESLVQQNRIIHTRVSYDTAVCTCGIYVFAVKVAKRRRASQYMMWYRYLLVCSAGCKERAYHMIWYRYILVCSAGCKEEV